MSHTFLVPAYGDSPWLGRCLDSIRAQTVSATVVVATSTPSAFISRTAGARDVPVVVNAEQSGIAGDWNFALSRCRSTWATLAHQDDWYAPTYLQSCLDLAVKSDSVALIFTASDEREASDPTRRGNTLMKRVIAGVVFGRSRLIDWPARKKLLLAFGNPIPCPSVMLNLGFLGAFRFPEGWRSNLDWKAWLDLAKRPGSFGYINEALVFRTLHEGAATSQWLSARAEEDSRLLREIWPAPAAGILSRVYGLSRRPYKRFETTR